MPSPSQSPRNGTSPGTPKKKLSSGPRFHNPVAGSTKPISSAVSIDTAGGATSRPTATTASVTSVRIGSLSLLPSVRLVHH